MDGRIALRPASRADYDFALRLYVQTIRPYSQAYFDWIDAEQAARFARLYDPGRISIVTLEGQAVGWLAVDEGEAAITLGQLCVAPGHQRQGIGSAVLRMLLRRWQRRGKPVVLEVLRNNPARRLYERFGFRVVGATDMKFRMERSADWDH